MSSRRIGFTDGIATYSRRKRMQAGWDIEQVRTTDATGKRASVQASFGCGRRLLGVRRVIWVAAIALLVVTGAVLAMAEASVTRITKVRLVNLREEGRRGVEILEEIEENLPRYLNSVYLSVMCVQNGSAILVAIVTANIWGELGVMIASVLFTIGYFVAVEAMSKTFAVLPRQRRAGAVAHPLGAGTVFCTGRRAG